MKVTTESIQGTLKGITATNIPPDVSRRNHESAQGGEPIPLCFRKAYCTEDSRNAVGSAHNVLSGPSKLGSPCRSLDRYDGMANHVHVEIEHCRAGTSGCIGRKRTLRITAPGKVDVKYSFRSMSGVKMKEYEKRQVSITDTVVQSGTTDEGKAKCVACQCQWRADVFKILSRLMSRRVKFKPALPFSFTSLQSSNHPSCISKFSLASSMHISVTCEYS